MKRIKLIILFLNTFTAQAGYFVVDGNCNLKETPQSNGRLIQRLVPDDVLDLLESEDHNGYYRVQVHGTTNEGWVYYTYLTWYDEDIEEEQPVAGGEGVLKVRIVDVGQGLCNLITLPNGKYIIYDAGDEDYLRKGIRTYNQMKDVIPPGSDIELMVLSHTDADHICAAANVILNYKVKNLMWGGYEAGMIGGTTTGSYNRLIAALAQRPNTKNCNLHERDSVLVAGTGLIYGDVALTWICGFGEPPAEWADDLDRAEKLNGVSIVMKLQYANKSILFCGDAVGRHRDDPADALIATEKYMVEHAWDYLPSTVVIAPHHGAKNGSSQAFVDRVRPEYVIFSAGTNKFRHPTSLTAERYLEYTTTGKMFRTDRGDDEGEGEWDYMRIDGCADKYKDDDIQVEIKKNANGSGNCRVFYLNNNNVCP
jgi:beta-lactamase superfamily II metal-dependent hydrolase